MDTYLIELTNSSAHKSGDFTRIFVNRLLQLPIGD